MELEKSDFWIHQIVRAGKYASFIFRVEDNQKGFKIGFNGEVEEEGKDLRFIMMNYNDYEKWTYWKAHTTVIKTDDRGEVVKDASGYAQLENVPEPVIHKFVNLRTNLFRENFDLTSDTYALIFDNTYSSLTDKTVTMSVSEQWKTELPAKSLPVVKQLLDEVPSDVYVCLTKADQCYTSAQYEQASVMLRKAVEFAIKIKLLQSGASEKEIFDSEGNELSLSAKIALLRKNSLITQRTSRDLDQVKWFGDMAAHGQMKIMQEDVRDNIEPKVRSFLTGLNLKPKHSSAI